ncbi:family 43 glycoside hydrolase [Lyophyllum atratum]|nr:family 43 glycoside hydrolase [Lyophyllum atratum]
MFFVPSLLALLGITTTYASPIAELVGRGELAPQVNSSYVGYLFVHFYDREPSIFAHLSNGNNPISYVALNGDNAILKPTIGTKGARDPYLASRPDNSKHFIIATDLDIVAIGNNWGTAVTKGSRGILVWESTDLVNWSAPRLATVMPATAGMVWAPEAVWDTATSSFLVHWASRTYAASDTAHTGAASLDQIWYSHTTDFITFTTPQIYITISGTPVIDLTILPLGGTSYARFIKNENVLRVWEERSTNGLFGTWTRVGSSTSYLTNLVTEGPLTFQDNTVANRVYTFLDEYGGDSTAKGYVPFFTDNISGGAWTQASTASFPKNVKHGVVKPVTQAQYNAIKAKWP